MELSCESQYRVVHQYTARRQDELSLKVGDLIQQVEVREGEGGWARGKLHADYGYFPLNHATRITLVEPVVTRGRHHKVLHPYKSQRPGDLDLQLGDIIEFITEVEPGWWRGRLGEKVGVFPNNYVSDQLGGCREPESPVVLRRNSRVKSFHASIDQNLGPPLSNALFNPEDEPVGPLFGSISSQLDWTTASLSSFKAQQGFFGRVRQSLSTKSLFPRFLRGRLSTTSLNDKSSIGSPSIRSRRNSFASFFHRSNGKLQVPPTPSPSRAEKWRRLTGLRNYCSTPVSRLDQDLRKLSLSGSDLKSPRSVQQSRSWVFQQPLSGRDLQPSTGDSGVTDLDLEIQEEEDEIFGPILEITDEVFEDMFDNKKNPAEASTSSHNTSTKSRLSKIKTSFSPFEKKQPVARRSSIATNPNVMWRQKPNDDDEIKITEL